jgi:hypothetical protein
MGQLNAKNGTATKEVIEERAKELGECRWALQTSCTALLNGITDNHCM